LAKQCATAYSESYGIGCTVSDTDGNTLFEVGSSCSRCKVCEFSGLSKDRCMRVHAYGMTEAERFGGKYIYFCPMGLTCLVSPILSRNTSIAKITAGPFLMVDAEDYMTFDLRERLRVGEEKMPMVLSVINQLPYIPADKVNALSILLFMAVGFINNVSDANRMLEIQDTDAIQGQITEYILALKAAEDKPYPFETEKALLASIAESDKQAAQKLLNELLGHILLSSGGNLAQIKSRIYELLALISRAAVDAGADSDETFRMNHNFYQKSAAVSNFDSLCFLLADLMNKYIDNLIPFSYIKNADILNKAIHFMRHNCDKKICLEDIAKIVFLSPTYFSKIFKQETGQSFNAYLNRLRVEKSKKLLLQSRLHLVDIANLSGFEDQSYYTKVFKRVTGMSPNQYRKSGGRAYLKIPNA